MNYVQDFLAESKAIIDLLDNASIEAMARVLSDTKKRGGRLFFVGSGGGAGHSSHAACDFRKLGGIESYSVTDNVSELTARVNDESWEDSYANWLRVSNLNSKDCIFVFSVGGGDADAGISLNLVNAMKLAEEVGASIVGVAGRNGGYLAKSATACIVVPTVTSANLTTQVEGFQAMLWHLLVQHPALESATPMWESVLP
jgi:D-sedoheptulose 7-phosphate isomerase